MRRARIVWLLLSGSLLITLVALLTFGGVSAWRFRRDALERASDALHAQATLLAELAAERLATGGAGDVDRLCKELGRRAGTRLTIVRPDGAVVGDSEADPRSMAPHGDRPEVIAALAGGVGRANRYSPTLRQRLLYVAVPIAPEGRSPADRGAILGAARASVDEGTALRGLRAFEARLLLAWLVVALVAAGVAVVTGRRLAGSLLRLRDSVDGLAGDRPIARVPPAGPGEVADLAEALNSAAVVFDARLRTALRERGELEAVLLSMMEGVLAVDGEERVLRLNDAAARLLRLDRERAAGRPIQEVIRNVELQRFIARVLAGGTPQEGELALRDAGDGTERIMQAHGTTLRDERGGAIGALVVLNDVTRLRRLEGVRREFVANVSHELKTPVTSIKGFVETLLDGAYRQPDEALRFLGIVAEQADRLNAIIEELLMLSRLEQQEGGERPVLSEQRARPVLEAAVQTCSPLARERSVTIALECPDDLEARLNPALIEQAVVNLIDNAVKYSEGGRSVRIVAARGPSGGGLEIRVIDQGAGIPAEHLPHLFERFYRVDKGRGRKQGGTGLGLAIVKHIAQVHGGSVDVESRPGSGSTFTLRLP